MGRVDINLHDGLIEQVLWAPQPSVLQWVLVVGDLQCGYERLVLRYEGVEAQQLDVETLATRSQEKSTELLYDEVDIIAPGCFAHRILFWPQDELDIVFRHIMCWRSPLTTRRRRALDLRFQQVDHVELPREDGTR